MCAEGKAVHEWGKRINEWTAHNSGIREKFVDGFGMEFTSGWG